MRLFLQNPAFCKTHFPPCGVISHLVRYGFEAVPNIECMLISPTLVVSNRAVDAAQLVGPSAHADAVSRELVSVRAEVRAAVEAFERATDDTERLRAIQRSNRLLEWTRTLIATLGDVIEREPIF